MLFYEGECKIKYLLELNKGLAPYENTHKVLKMCFEIKLFI